MSATLLPGMSTASTGAPLERVTVDGPPRSAEEIRKAAVSVMAVITKADLEKFGDTATSDALRRLPGVAVDARTGQVRYRGLGAGYTVVSVNGSPVPPSFSIDTIPAAQIERIEVIPIPLATSGVQGAGATINVVLRSGAIKATDDYRLTGGKYDDALSAWLVKSGSRQWVSSSYNYSFQYSNEGNVWNILTRGDGIDGRSDTRLHETARARTVSIHQGYKHRFLSGADASISAFVQRRDLRLAETADLEQANLLQRNLESTRAEIWAARLGVDIRAPLSEQLTGQTKLAFTHGSRDAVEEGLRANARETVSSTAQDRSAFASQSVEFAAADAVSVAVGADVSSVSREERYQWEGDGGQTEGPSSARQQVVAYFVQGELEPAKQLKVLLGLRRNHHHERWRDPQADTRTRSRSLSPSVGLTWESSWGQVRLAAGRVTKNPGTRELSRHQWTMTDNSPLNPDTTGNPGLRAERVSSIELGLQSVKTTLGIAGLTISRKTIDGYIARRVQREGERWTSQPFNLDEADLTTLTVELRQGRRPIGTGNLEFNVDASRHWQHVKGLGPTRAAVSGFSPLTMNLGLSYRPGRSSLAGGLNLQHAARSRYLLAESLHGLSQRRTTAEIFASWRINPQAQGKLAILNLTGQSLRSAAFTGTGPALSYERVEEKKPLVRLVVDINT